MSSREQDIQQKLGHLRELCDGDDGRVDLLEAALALSMLRSDTAPDLTPFRQHVAAMASDLADLVRRRGASPEQLAEVIARSYAYRGDSESYDDLKKQYTHGVIDHDEEAFRFNNRETSDGIRFLRLCRSVAGKRLTFKQLTGAKA